LKGIALDQMLKDLLDPDPTIKKMAARAILRESDDPGQVLAGALDGADTQTLEAVLDVLFNSDGDFTEIFSGMTRHEDASIRAKAIRYLFRKGAFTPADAVAWLEDADPYVRRRAISYLFWMNDAPSLASVSRMCTTDPDESVRKDCLRLLSIWGGEKDLEHVIKALEDESFEVRLQAVQTLRRLTGEDFGDPAGAAPDEFEWIVAKWQGWWELTRKQQ